MKWGSIVALLIGIASAAYIIAYVGVDQVLLAMLSVGWSGFALLCLSGLSIMALLGLAWSVLVPPVSPRSISTFIWARAIRDSAGDVLPLSQIGGMVIGARALTLRGLPASTAFASMVVDVTVEMIAQIAFIIIGLLLFAARVSGAGASAVLETMIFGVLTAVVLAALFIVFQRRGFAFFERIAQHMLPQAASGAGTIDEAVARLHGDRRRLALGFAIHLAGWTMSAFVLWLTLSLLGAPLHFADALAIESILCAARSAAIFVPAAIGVQEAGYAFLMPLFGLTTDIGLAVSLLKRAREITVAIPILLSWQIAEGNQAASGLSETKS